MTPPPPGAERTEVQPGKKFGSRLLHILSDLIGFDTTSRNSNLRLISYVQDYLDRYKVESELVYDTSGNKANL